MKPPQNAPIFLGVAACLALVTGVLLPSLLSPPRPEGLAKETAARRQPQTPVKAAPQPAAQDTPPENNLPSSASTSTGPLPEEVERADVGIQKILADNPTVETAGSSLVTAYPDLKPAEKVAAAPHLAGLLPDDQAQVLVELLKSPDSPGPAKEIFFNNLLNRPHAIAWPMLVEVLATPNHHLADRAKEMLMALIGRDLGSSVDAWRHEVAHQLRPLE